MGFNKHKVEIINFLKSRAVSEFSDDDSDADFEILAIVVIMIFNY